MFTTLNEDLVELSVERVFGGLLSKSHELNFLLRYHISPIYILHGPLQQEHLDLHFMITSKP